MTPPDGRASVLPVPARWVKALPALGVALIWAFLIVFLVYPLLRLFYDAFTDDADRKSTRLNSSHIQKSRMPSSA